MLVMFGILIVVVFIGVEMVKFDVF